MYPLGFIYRPTAPQCLQQYRQFAGHRHPGLLLSVIASTWPLKKNCYRRAVAGYYFFRNDLPRLIQNAYLIFFSQVHPDFDIFLHGWFSFVWPIEAVNNIERDYYITARS